MRRYFVAVSFLALTIIFVTGLAQAQSEQAKQITCTGKVVDEQSRPMAGVKISLHEMVYDEATYTYNPNLLGEVQTETDGVFSFSTGIESDAYRHGYIVAAKEGLALGIGNWNMREGDKELEIILGPPGELVGIVVDENDKPVLGAQVSISLLKIFEGNKDIGLGGPVATRLFTSTTDAAGKFALNAIPTDAMVEFLIKKPGRATISTYRSSGIAGQKLKYVPGQTGIKLVLPIEAKIEGIVVENNTGKPISGMKVMARSTREIAYFRQKPAVSDANGRFSISALPADGYTLEIAQPREELADWVAQPIEVITEAGKTKSGIKIELSKGGVLEVVLKDAVSKKPVEKASVSLRNQANSRYHSARSNENGMAQIRLVPGDYQVDYIYKQGYARQRLQDALTIKDSKTERLEYELVGMPKITGIVQDENGLHIEGVELEICPGGGREEFVSDSKGRFEIAYDLGSWPSGRTPVMFLVGRHNERNLATAVQVDEDTRELDIKLEPAVAISGEILDPNGKGIANARVMVMLQGPRWGSTIGHEPTMTDQEGRYEIKALPMGHKYEVYARADGYGENRSEEFSTENAVDNRLDMGRLTLAVANLSVSGIIVDDSDKPVPGARISGYGDNQPHRGTQTDVDGKFTLEEICAGKIRISANKSGAIRLYGSIETEGGATGVRIVISQRPSSTHYEPKRPPSLVGRPLPKLKEAGIDLPQAETDGKMMLVCLFDMEQRPSRHCITQLAKQSEQLKDKGVTIVAIQASKMDQDALNQWKNKYNIPFPIGMVQSDTEKARFTWGIRSLPWLILTDRKHIVEANGFSMAELDEKI